jgi:MFS family permease
VAFKRPPHFWRNVLALLLDSCSFGFGISFISPSTVIPVLARQLTSSQMLVGLLATVWNGAWLLPQLEVGRWLADKKHKKPYLLAASALGRPFLLLMALALAWGNQLPAAALLTMLFVALFVFRGTDAVAAVAWFDVMSGAIPPERRGRVFGASQSIIGLLSLGAAMVVQWALGPHGPTFPRNFALLFGLASMGVFSSWCGLTMLKELDGEPDTSHNTRLNILEHAQSVIAQDQAFRMLTIVRMLSGLAALSWTFYVLHATRVLGLPESILGLFTATQAVACVVTSVATGWMSERLGTVKVIQFASVAALIAPVVGLILDLAPLSTSLVIAGYVIIYSSLSAIDYSYMLGYVNYVLEIAPPGQRPAYMGLTNTLGGLLIVLPTLGGWILEKASYPVLFGITAIGTLAGLIASLRLPPSRALTPRS